MILFRHAQIYDGTGQKPFLGDVLVRNDRIAKVGQNLEVPEDTEILNVEEGKDYVTLVTCTPYGVNTHRLLERGQRVP